MSLFLAICSRCKRVSQGNCRVSSLRFPKTQMVLASSCMRVDLHINAVFKYLCHTYTQSPIRMERGWQSSRVDKWTRGWYARYASEERLKTPWGMREGKRRVEYILIFRAAVKTSPIARSTRRYLGLICDVDEFTWFVLSEFERRFAKATRSNPLCRQFRCRRITVV